MVKSKTDLFDLEIQECAEFYKALSHPARIAILKYLAETKTYITGDISDELPLSRSTVNQHLSGCILFNLCLCIYYIASKMVWT